ncbi:MAG: ribonuclease P protein component [Alphaproteobacteria bacterium]|nr:ribonuclease P protein component [Alphaproteobacteria bacterium]
MPQSKTLSVLKKRSDFLSVASHKKKWVAPAFILQIAPRPIDLTHDKAAPACGLGLTASKKMIGNAVQRNRARRRLRALAREVLGAHAVPGHNFVLIARKDVLTQDYAALRAELQKALKRMKVWREDTV